MAHKLSDLLTIDKEEAALVYEWYLEWSRNKFIETVEKDIGKMQEIDKLQKTFRYFLSDED